MSHFPPNPTKPPGSARRLFLCHFGEQLSLIQPWKSFLQRRDRVHKVVAGAAVAECLNGGYGWLEIRCKRCQTRVSLPLDAICRPRNTPIWKLEAALKCRSCRTPRYSPPVHMIKLTKEREIAPYAWVHPDDDDRR
jgi:hypothetical protein